MELAVEDARREAQHVLPMEFVGDARERRVQVVGLLQLEPSAAGRIGQPADALVGVRRDAEDVAFEADAVNHEILGLRALGDRVQRRKTAALVVAVREEQHDAPPIDGGQFRHAVVDRVPEPRAVAVADAFVDVANQIVAIRREGGAGDDLVVEVGDARPIGREEANDERLGGVLQQLEVHRHAAARVERQQRVDGLDVALEERGRLQRAVVVALEGFLLEVGNEPAGAVNDRRVERDGLRPAAEERRLLLGLPRDPPCVWP